MKWKEYFKEKNIFQKYSYASRLIWMQFSAHLVFILYEMTCDQTCGVFKLFPNIQVCIFKIRVTAELTELFATRVPFNPVHLHCTSWKFLKALTYECHPLQVSRDHASIFLSLYCKAWILGATEKIKQLSLWCNFFLETKPSFSDSV